MKIKPSFPLAVIVGALLLAGCATPFRAPPGAAHLQLDRGDSPTVIVDKIWLARGTGPLVVAGSVVRRLDVTDTTQTHLDVTLYDAGGGVLRRTVEYFDPRQILPQHRRPATADYRIILDPLPAGAVRVEVRAHDGSHENP
ncbi:MAG: hypothetical protein Q8J74_06380 [Candidatus Didemnitutus sp.]|nr:hypothetical protein [Candidatus Didemnitutus sp.]